MTLHHVRRGAGPPLVLVHGLGSRWQTWSTIAGPLAAHRELILVDLPGHGDTPPLDGEVTIERLADELETFLRDEALAEADLVGSSMGARLVLELARRGLGGDTVALGPGGFWTPGEVRVFHTSLKASVALLRAIPGALPTLLGNPVTRTALYAQFAARPWALSADTVLDEVHAILATPAFDESLDALATGPLQLGAPVASLPGRLTIGWGRRDRVLVRSQAARAVAAFPGAQLVWFERCGHFPHLERPDATADLVLERTGRG